MKSVSAKYTLFSSAGLPIRAVCSLSLEEMPPEQPKQNPTSGSDARAPCAHLHRRGLLASVAYAEYGDPAAWRAVARFNGIDDPLRCAAGSTAADALPRGAVTCPTTNTFLVEIDGSALPADVAALLTSGYVDDSQQYPDLFELRFRDPGHVVLTKTGAQVGSDGPHLGHHEHERRPAAADDR